MPVSIRPATEEDADGVARVLNDIVRAGGLTIIGGPVSVEEQGEWIRAIRRRGAFHVAVDDRSGQVVGWQCVEPHSSIEPALGHVADIATFVPLGAQRQGIGARLTAATFAAAEARGFLKIIATIRADNPQALAFYRSQGFEAVGTLRKHACVDGRYVDEVLTEKLLGRL